MNLEKYPHTDEEINIWNSYLNRSKIFPIELLINKNNKNFINLQKIFETLKLDKVKPKVFIESYINAKTKNNMNHFVKIMTNLFISHKVNKSLSEGQSIKSARTQTVARLLCLSFNDPNKTGEENFKDMKKIVRACTKDIRV
ncbi:MAG: hypothetical protein HN480_04865 [Gammaproteobacteria bacterium]|jgi:hypothetical protein|nr:hypothetical protein [Gammaproteobacteria bacterium]MBT7523367.1 hypothetical protein [Gammaproteobacteria bacterium]MBT7814293.1 hypothetical protein [Gammaproteobacteria bacterium]